MINLSIADKVHGVIGNFRQKFKKIEEEEALNIFWHGIFRSSRMRVGVDQNSETFSGILRFGTRRFENLGDFREMVQKCFDSVEDKELN